MESSAHPKPKPKPVLKPSAREIAALSDAELGRYLERHRLGGSTGSAIEVNVEDPENLPESFIERLRDRAQRASGTAPA